MKKILIAFILGLVGIGCYAFEDDNDFTYADYEVLCFKYNSEPNWEQYLELVSNPQCFEDDSVDIVFAD